LKNAEENVLKMILGNKTDLEILRAIPTCHGEKTAKKYDIPFYEVSAKDDVNIKEAIYFMASAIYKEKVKLNFSQNSKILVS